MGIEEAVHILINILKEYASHFSREDFEIIIETCYEAIALSIKNNHSEQEEIDFESIKISLCHISNKIKLAAINEGKSYTHISKIIDILG
jgi:hypothetical protein